LRRLPQSGHVTEIIGPGAKPETRRAQDKDNRSIQRFTVHFLRHLFQSSSGFPSFSGAQTKSSILPGNAPTDMEVDPGESVALALKQNPTQQIAVANAAESIQDKNITRSDLLPQADFRSRIPQPARTSRLSLWQVFLQVPRFRGTSALTRSFRGSDVRHVHF